MSPHANSSNGPILHAGRLAATAVWLNTQEQNLEQNERAYKLSGARDSEERLHATLSGAGPTKVNVQPGNNLNMLSWRTAGGLNALVNRGHAAFRDALATLRRDPVNPDDVNAFWTTLTPLADTLPDADRKPISGQGTRASIASYFLFLAQPEHHPFYRPTFGGQAVEWLYGGQPLDRQSTGHLLHDYVRRCATLLPAFQAAGVPLRDMLDLQGALYLISSQYPGGPRSADVQPADPLRAEYEAFRADPVQAFRCEVRLTRAAQVSARLRDADAVTLTEFNRDVWQFESDATLDGVSVRGTVYSDVLGADRAAELTDALREERLSLWGNYCWGSATTVYGAQLNLSDDEKQRLVRQALHILGNDALSPLEKVQQIEAVPGFGPNSATGMTMLVHPDAVALNNRPSRDALKALGYDVSTPAAMQDSAAALLERVGADTFPELDWFLYTRASRTGHWWVNQGRTYDEECAGGYVWASQETNRTVQHHENVARLKPGDRILHYAGQTIRAVSTVSAPPVEVNDERQSASIPSKRFGYLATTDYRPLPQPVPISSLEPEWRTAQHGPFDKNGTVQLGYLFEVSPALFDRVTRTRDGSDAAQPSHDAPFEPRSFGEIQAGIEQTGLKIDRRTLRRYHLALQTRGFVILSGVSGTGKTWLAEAYAEASGARVGVFPVAPNWTSNEDLLGFYSPLDGGHYHHTAFSRFLLEAAEEYRAARAGGRPPRPYHLILDEMNLARVEYYFAQFLSRMEFRARHPDRETTLTLGPDLTVVLGPNVTVTGTVNVDETTYDFADKVYDRAQLIELSVNRDDLATHLTGNAQADLILSIWDVIHPVAPFAFRIVDELTEYQAAARQLGLDPLDALDDAVLQKVLPKLRGTDARLLGTLSEFLTLVEGTLPLSHAKAGRMRDEGTRHGFISFH
ncbi:McrB family protein [Deinococcus sp. JMULE3]|uniref:McrB family protein n=1 Tax=Deinococcus sp. JMULE3 TaxID=2518341 RepID=UPI001575BB8E|nr:AAA family ATPase [Deinococcus sp. JMULE3]